MHSCILFVSIKDKKMFDKFLDAVMEIIAYTEGENTWGELEIDHDQ